MSSNGFVSIHNWLDDAPSDDEVGEEQQEDDEGDTLKLNSPDPAPAPNVIEVLYDSDGLYYRARLHKSWQLKTTREWRHSVVWEVAPDLRVASSERRS